MMLFDKVMKSIESYLTQVIAYESKYPRVKLINLDPCYPSIYSIFISQITYAGEWYQRSVDLWILG